MYIILIVCYAYSSVAMLLYVVDSSGSVVVLANGLGPRPGDLTDTCPLEPLHSLHYCVESLLPQTFARFQGGAVRRA